MNSRLLIVGGIGLLVVLGVVYTKCDSPTSGDSVSTKSNAKEPPKSSSRKTLLKKGIRKATSGSQKDALSPKSQGDTRASEEDTTPRGRIIKDHRKEGSVPLVENPPVFRPPDPSRPKKYFSKASMKSTRSGLQSTVDECISNENWELTKDAKGLAFVQLDLVVEVKDGVLKVNDANAQLANVESDGLKQCLTEALVGNEISGVEEPNVDAYRIILPFRVKK